MGTSGNQHWLVVKHVPRYLNGSVNTLLKYGKDRQNSSGAQGIVDSDFTEDCDKKNVINWIMSSPYLRTVRWKASLQYSSPIHY